MGFASWLSLFLLEVAVVPLPSSCWRAGLFTQGPLREQLSISALHVMRRTHLEVQVWFFLIECIHCKKRSPKKWYCPLHSVTQPVAPSLWCLFGRRPGIATAHFSLCMYQWLYKGAILLCVCTKEQYFSLCVYQCLQRSNTSSRSSTRKNKMFCKAKSLGPTICLLRTRHSMWFMYTVTEQPCQGHLMSTVLLPTSVEHFIHSSFHSVGRS